MFRFYNGLSSLLMNNIFKLRAKNPSNFRRVSEFSKQMVESVYHNYFILMIKNKG